MMQRARVLLVGTGRMGQVRAALMRANPRFDIAGIIDSNMDSAVSMADKYMTKAFPTLTDAISFYNRRQPSSSQHRPLHGIILSTPTDTHTPLVTEAAHHHLSTFTEKPVDDTAAKITSLFSVAAHHGVQICCGFQRRFDTTYVAAREAVKEGHLGKVHTVRATFGDHPRPTKEFLLRGGCIYSDLSAHDVDYVRWCLGEDGEEVVSVYAVGTSSCDELEAVGVHDNAYMVVTFRSGAVASFYLSRGATYGYDQRCEIFGTSGMVNAGNTHLHNAVLHTKKGIVHSPLEHSFPQRFEKAFAAEMDAFADVLLGGVEWPVTREDCITVQKVSDAARLSTRLGRVVTIEELEAPVQDVAYCA